MSDNKNGLCGVYKPTGIISASSNIVEIIGGAGLEFAFKDLNMDAKCTYKSEQLPFHVEVWEVSANDFKTLCDYPDEEWKDVDGIAKYITIYFLGHLCKMMGIKNSYSRMYEAEMAKYKVEKPEYEDDDEALFDAVFGGELDDPDQ